MNVQITFNTDNASFDDYLRDEMAYVMAQCAEYASAACENDELLERSLRDTNGNTIGKIAVADA